MSFNIPLRLISSPCDRYGNDTLTLTVNDQMYLGAGEAKSDTKQVCRMNPLSKYDFGGKYHTCDVDLLKSKLALPYKSGNQGEAVRWLTIDCVRSSYLFTRYRILLCSERAGQTWASSNIEHFAAARSAEY